MKIRPNAMWIELGLQWILLSACATAEASAWERIASTNHFVMMRHAIAPGTGDPANFTIDDCATQRNLSSRGRDQARTIGNAFRAHGIDRGKVYSSAWCRCLDTAELLSLGDVTPLPSLNSFFQSPEKRDSQTRLLRQWIREQPLESPVVLVTHQVNITALTGIFPSSGEMLVIARGDEGGLHVVERVLIDE